MNWVKMRKRSTLGNRYHDTISFLFVVCIYIYMSSVIMYIYILAFIEHIHKKYEYVYIMLVDLQPDISLFLYLHLSVCESSVNHRSFHPQENTQRLLRRRCPSGTLRHGAFNLSQWCKFAKGGCKPVWWDGFSRFFGGYGRFGDCMIQMITASTGT